MNQTKFPLEASLIYAENLVFKIQCLVINAEVLNDSCYGYICVSFDVVFIFSILYQYISKS